MKILVSAFTCWPTESSEPGVAWRFVQEWMKDHEVWLLTQAAPGPLKRIREFLQISHAKNLHLCSFPNWSPDLETIEPYVNLYSALWQRTVILHARRLHKQHHFDLVHHVTFSRYWEGSSLVDLGIPFLWGPLGAGESPPASLLEGLPIKSKLTCILRSFSKGVFECSPFLRKTARKASVAFATTQDTALRLKALGVRNTQLMPQIAFSEKRIQELQDFCKIPELSPIHLLSVGRLLYWKGFHLGLHVAAELIKRGLKVQYKIINDGPMRQFLQSLVNKLDIESNVEFLGRISRHEDVLSYVGHCHALLHPALHEGFGNICLEALAIGKPVVCLDIGGPATQVTTDCGYAASGSDVATAICQMADFIESLTMNMKTYIAYSNNAKSRVAKNFTASLQMKTLHEATSLALNTNGN